tara:strand:+ start:194 stop:1030 length:837 start_codon:yes stop_codon:yes gene_type:complete
MNKINICFCVDEQGIDLVPIVVDSILDKNEHNQIKVHLIHNIKNREMIANLKSWVVQFENFSFYDYFKEWDREYHGLPHVSNACMLRLLIPEIIQEKKVLYLDIDLIVNLDLMEVFKIDLTPSGLGIKESVWHTCSELTTIKARNDKGVFNLTLPIKELKKDMKKWGFQPKMGNCGVMLMDLEILRKKDFTGECFKIHKKNSHQHDQWIINEYYQGNYTRLKPEFNVFIGQDDHLLGENDDFIAHYVGGTKPYLYHTGKYQDLWTRHYERVTGPKLAP